MNPQLCIKLGLVVVFLRGIAGQMFGEPTDSPPAPAPAAEESVTEKCAAEKSGEPSKAVQLKEGEAWEPMIQPNLTRWALVSERMPCGEVEALLGKPLQITDLSEQFTHLGRFQDRDASTGFAYGWTYGWLRFDSPAFPQPLEFQIRFVDDVVYELIDPFDGARSGKGKPTTPKLILPDDREEFRHTPRWLDLRWTPAAGVYPMEYEIEVEEGTEGTNFNYASDRFRKMRMDKTKRYTSEVPQLTIAYPERGSGRWRVRAKNALGKSDWSELRSFLFAR